MTLLESLTIPLGTPLTPFQLPDTEGIIHSSTKIYEQRVKGLLVVFTCNHCPYALAVWPRLIRLASYAKEHNISTVAINPNIHPDFPQDAPNEMKKKITAWGVSFPYLIDETQDIARSFKAQCTPDIYLFNSKQKLVYHGRIDDNWQNEHKVIREDLKDAITRIAENEVVNPEQYPSLGCSIKWKSSHG
jgi:hypothetical protein